MKLKVGDTVEILGNAGMGNEKTAVVLCIDRQDDSIFINPYPTVGAKCGCGRHSWVIQKKCYKIISSSITTNMSITEKFALSFKKEPKKSLIKAGILNLDETFTTDGKVVWDAWLLNKFEDEFKKEVAEPILAEEEKTKA